MFEQARQFETDRLLRGIGQMQQMGLQNILPAFDLAARGILPPETVVHPSKLEQFAGPLAGLSQVGANIFRLFQDDPPFPTGGGGFPGTGSPGTVEGPVYNLPSPGNTG